MTDDGNALANRVLQEQGYIVMASFDDLPIGAQRRLFNKHTPSSGEVGLVVVIGNATEREFLDQEVRFGYGDGEPGYGTYGHYYYRVTAE